MVKFNPSPDGRWIWVKTPYSLKDEVKKIVGRQWNKVAKVWEVPIENIDDALKVFPDAIIAPELIQQIEGVQARTQTALAIKEMKDAPRNVDGVSGTLYNYQAVGKAFLHNLQPKEGAILAFDMGLGKSITSIAETIDLFNTGQAKRCLVVCPASLKYSTWEKELKKWTNASYIVIDGEPYNLEDREVLIEVEEEVWELDDKGKRKYELESIYAEEQLYMKDKPILLTYAQDNWVVDGKLDFWTYVAPLLNAELNSEKDTPITATVGQRETASTPENLSVLMQDNSRYIIGAVVKRWVRDKKTYNKIKTGKIIEKVVRMTGKSLREIQYQQDDRQFVIVNYEAFLVDMDLMPKIDESWVVILDECHRIKNRTTATTKNLLATCENAGRKFLLSGTPLENNIEELWSITNFARKGLLGTWYKFRERYVVTDDYGSSIMPNYSKLKELREKIAPLMLRRTKQESLADLPPLLEQEYWVDMTPLQKELYATIKEGIIDSWDNDVGDTTYLSVLAQLTRIQQLLDSPALLREVTGNPDLPENSGKLDELDNILEDINVMQNKVIVFSQYREMTEILHSRLVAKYGIKAVRYIHGGVKTQLRGIHQNDFQDDDAVRVMVLTTAGNYGLDLYKASYVILYDQLFNPQKMAQVVSRAHRNGAVQPVTAISLVTRDSYEERKLAILSRKKELFSAVIEDDDIHMETLLTKEELKNLL